MSIFFRSLVFIFVLSSGFLWAQDAASTTSEAATTTVNDVEDPVATAEVQDTLIKERLEAIFANVPDLESVTIEVRDGVVLLSGTTLNAGAREDAMALANQIDNVIYVVNNTEQETAVDKTLTPALAKIRNYISDTIALLPLLLVALFVVLIFWWLASLVSRWDAFYERLGINPLLQALVRQFVRLAVLLLGLLLALDILGATPFVAAILGTAGVAGLALGFAFRDIVENYLAGILMSLRQPFSINDAIKIDSHSGKVIRLTPRELVLMTFDGNHVRIPNATVFKSEIYNYSRNPRRRFDFTVGVDVQEDLVYVQELGVETLKAMTGVMGDPEPFSLVEEMGDYNVIVRFYGWVDQREASFGKVKSQAIRLLKHAFDDANVLMPEPITNVRLQHVPTDVRLGEAVAAPQQKPSPAQQATQTQQKPRLTAEESLRSVEQAMADIDISIDTQLDEQIAEEHAMAEEDNLLTEDENQKKPPA